MNDSFIKTFTIDLKEEGASEFICILNTDRKLKVALHDFYELAIKTDKKLELHSLSCSEWEELTEELIYLEYDFKKVLNEYVQTFSEKQIRNFSEAPSIDFGDDDDDDDDDD